MAPVVSLPIREMARLPDIQPKASKRWADVEDSPSPWRTGCPLPDFKQAWPDTPTPSDAICNAGLPFKRSMHPALAQMFAAQSEMPEHSALAPLPLQTLEWPYAALAQTCLSEMQINSATGLVGVPMQSIEGSYIALTQPCLDGLPLQQNFPVYEVDPTLHNINESVVMQVPAWGCEFNESNYASEGGYSIGMQWPSFALPQQSAAPDSLPVLGQWQTTMEEVSTPPQEASCPAPADAQTGCTEPRATKMQHSSGQCRPCAWFWREQGCRNGSACTYCHVCPEGELKARKKNKIAAMKMGALTPMKASSQTSSGWGLKLDSLLQDKP